MAKPGSTPAGPTSRPIIVGHQASLGQDPLLAKIQSAASDLGGAPELKLTKQKKISPNTPEASDETPADEQQAVKNQPSAADQAAQAKPQPETAASNSNAAIDALAGEVNAKAQAKEHSKDELQQQEKIRTLIESKQYSLPITEGGRKAASERVVSWLLIFLLLAAAVTWLAVDAGYLDIGIDLPYDLIKD